MIGLLVIPSNLLAGPLGLFRLGKSSSSTCAVPSSCCRECIPPTTEMYMATSYGLIQNSYSCYATSSAFSTEADAVNDAETKAAGQGCDVMYTHVQPVYGYVSCCRRNPTACKSGTCYTTTYRIWCWGGGKPIEATVSCGNRTLTRHLARAIALYKARRSGCRIRWSRTYEKSRPDDGGCCSGDDWIRVPNPTP